GWMGTEPGDRVVAGGAQQDAAILAELGWLRQVDLDDSQPAGRALRALDARGQCLATGGYRLDAGLRVTVIAHHERKAVQVPAEPEISNAQLRDSRRRQLEIDA